MSVALTSSVVISGMGAVSAVGTGCAALWSAIVEGRDGMRPLRRFATAEFSTPIAALVPDWDDPQQVPASGEPPLSRFVDLAELAAREALAQARLDEKSVAPQR